MKNNIVALLILFICLNPDVYSASESRLKYNFNYEWKVWVGDDADAANVSFDDKDWKNISLPYAWNEDEAFKNDIRELSTGIAWYRKDFFLPDDLKDKKVFIEFEGVRQAAKIFVNGKQIGLHENGIMAFGYDITSYINFGDTNLVAVRTDNDWEYKEKATETGYQWNDKNFNANYGGIPKNVILHVTGKTYQTLPLFNNLKTTGQYIYASDIDIENKTATINIETEVSNEEAKIKDITVEAEIRDLEGELVKTISGEKESLSPGEKKILRLSDELTAINFWSWGYGYLYTIDIILKQKDTEIDRVSIRTGFRKTAFENGMIKLNGRVLMVKGYAQRTSNEWPALGMSVPPWMSDYSNKLMVESNANLVRWMHTTPWKQDIESCDRVGLIQAMPAGDSEKDREGRQWEQRVEVMRDAIIYNRNNPSIIFYECGNNDISEEHMQQMKDLRDKYDPYGGRAIGSRNMLDSKVAEYGGEMLYINKSNSKPVWAMEYMRDEALRLYWDEYSFPYHKNGEGSLYKGKDASAYNQNQDAYAINVVKRWYDYYRERPGTGDQVSSGGVNIVFSETNTHHRGEENYRRSGETDALRIPKDAFFAHQVMWDGWVDVENHRTHIIGHWNYNEGTVKNVYVVSSGEKVELLVNGTSKGYGARSKGFLFTFDSIAWEKGTIEAISYDKENNVLSSAKLQTAGKAHAIKLSYMESPKGLRADAADIAMVQVEVVDKDGLRCPLAFDTISFELEGEAEWRGGMAKGEGNYILEKTLPVECGVNRVLIRSTTKAGDIKLSAVSKGLKPGNLLFQSTPVVVEGGLSLDFPSAKLPVNLDRGPTPKSPSFTVSRESIQIKSALAGSNQGDVALSYDGSQATRWVSDGKIENGWIEYHFNTTEQIDEIALKLSGWRTRSYPIEVTTGETVLYRGLTSPNLGYYYITLDNPVQTDKVKIRIYDQTEFDDKYKLVEITGKLDKETANDMEVNNAANLNIVEVEVYKVVR